MRKGVFSDTLNTVRFVQTENGLSAEVTIIRQILQISVVQINGGDPLKNISPNYQRRGEFITVSEPYSVENADVANKLLSFIGETVEFYVDVDTSVVFRTRLY